MDCGFSGAVVVMVITVLAGTPKVPSAGETTAFVTTPTNTMFARVVCPAETLADAEPAKAVCGALAFRFAVPANAGTIYCPVWPEMATIGNESVCTIACTGPALEETVPCTKPTG